MPDGPTRFMPLPEVFEPRKSSSSPAELREIRKRAAAALFALAGEAARSEARAISALRASACERCSNATPTARRPGGFWDMCRTAGVGPLRSRSASSRKKKSTTRPSAGCPRTGWDTLTAASFLPLRERARNGRRGCRLPRPTGSEPIGAHAGSLPPSTSISRRTCRWPKRSHSAARLEAFHDLFMTLFADVLGENLPMIRLFKNPKLEPDSLPQSRLHQVLYFASKAEFVDHLSPVLGPEVALNLGFYDPPKNGRGRVPAYFYRDPDGQIPETATLYHEVSHQLLFETAGPNSYTKNFGNFWVFEGLGTYFETITPQPDGSLEVGGLVGPRIAEAYQSLVVRHDSIPMAKFVAFDESTFRDKIQIYHNYQQAMALTVFLMQWNQGAYRDAFLDYVRDAYHGRIKRGTGRPLQDRLQQPYATLEKQFLTFLKDAKAAQLGPEPAEAKPVADGAIRTVPAR